ncbi:MAG: peroxiredoxin [Deltaproteobacteria bacterium]|nr:peroxiredoxin [Deltaproteobacteria bacterium]
MALKVGDTAPAFDQVASDGRRISLAELRGKKNVVLYFYPKDDTAVCTAEACGFRDQYPNLKGLDTEVVGVSADASDSHNDFTKKYSLPFPLLSDPDRALAKAYGAFEGIKAMLGRAARITYVIDKQGKIAGVFESEIFAKKHTEGVKAVVEKLARA